MIKFDSKTKIIELNMPEGEAQFMREVSSIIAALRDKLYEGGHDEDQVNNMCFAAFRIAMEDLRAFPYSPEAKTAIARLNRKENK